MTEPLFRGAAIGDLSKDVRDFLYQVAPGKAVIIDDADGHPAYVTLAFEKDAPLNWEKQWKAIQRWQEEDANKQQGR